MQVIAFLSEVRADNDLCSIELSLRLYPARGREAIALWEVIQEWMVKGSADLEFADPPPPGFIIVEGPASPSGG